MRHKSGWRIEEAGFGKPSESCFIVVDPTAEVDGILECCPIAPLVLLSRRFGLCLIPNASHYLVQACLKVVRDVMPGREIVIRHVDELIIMLIGQLWRQMQAYTEKHHRREKHLKIEKKAFYDLIQIERNAQDAKWGEQTHSDEKWVVIALEELGEVAKAVIENNDVELLPEIVQTVALLENAGLPHGTGIKTQMRNNQTFDDYRKG